MDNLKMGVEDDHIVMIASQDEASTRSVYSLHVLTIYTLRMGSIYCTIWSTIYRGKV